MSMRPEAQLAVEEAERILKEALMTQEIIFVNNEGRVGPLAEKPIVQVYDALTRALPGIIGRQLTNEPSREFTLMDVDGKFCVLTGMVSERYIQINRTRSVGNEVHFDRFILFSDGCAKAYLERVINGDMKKIPISDEKQEELCLDVAREMLLSINDPRHGPESLAEKVANEIFPSLSEFINESKSVIINEGQENVRLDYVSDDSGLRGIDIVFSSTQNGRKNGRSWFVGVDGSLQTPNGNLTFGPGPHRYNYHKAYEDVNELVKVFASSVRP